MEAIKSIKEYSWWGFDENSPPEHLKTKKQLSAIGLKPGEPVGVIRTPEYDCYLYDPATCPTKRPLTDRQKAALEKRKAAFIASGLEKRRAWAEINLKSYLERIPQYIQDILEDFTQELNPEIQEHWVRNRCDRITRACHYALLELRFLYPEAQPEPGSLVLGGQNRIAQPEPGSLVLGGQIQEFRRPNKIALKVVGEVERKITELES